MSMKARSDPTYSELCGCVVMLLSLHSMGVKVCSDFPFSALCGWEGVL